MKKVKHFNSAQGKTRSPTPSFQTPVFGEKKKQQTTTTTTNNNKKKTKLTWLRL